MRKAMMLVVTALCLGGSTYAGILPDYPANIEVKTAESKQLPSEYLLVTNCRERDDGKVDVTLQNVFVKDPNLVDKFVVTGNGKCVKGRIAVFVEERKILYVIIPQDQ